jgi:hypothetical protein
MFEMDAHVGVEVLGLMMMKVRTSCAVPWLCGCLVMPPCQVPNQHARQLNSPNFLQGEQPHCGFPENSYHMNCERLARAGLRVVVVEQV